MKEHVKELAEIDMLDHGSPRDFANMFAQGVAQHFVEAVELAKMVMGPGEIRNTPNVLAYLQREPIGVCGLILPWNVPLMVTAKIASALAVGNTCVVKPASVDSLPALKIAEILAEHDLPPGAVNILTGPGDVIGGAISSHPGVNMIAFTGSCETGKAIMQAASHTVKRLFMELGGKNPFIVLADADVNAAVEKAAFVAYTNTGMVCGSPGRYYVHESIYNEFIEKFVAASKKVVVGGPDNPKTMIGPVVSAEHRDKVEGYIKSAIKEGAKVMLGGKRPTTPPLNKGFFVMPTIIADVTPDMTVYREEIFGPVACIVKFSSEEKVIEQANDNPFGLSASVWTKNLAKGRRIANRIQAGTVWVNSHMEWMPELPWGGFKESGTGKEGGVMGLQEYTQVKVITLDMKG
jgi:acyl-CoA reductase-like NAD-dependent aldehyde dehydrogenase